jgi:hypothetical protein
MLQAATVSDLATAGCKLQNCGHAIRLMLAAGSYTTKEYYLDRRQQNRAGQGTNGVDTDLNDTAYGCKLQNAIDATLQAATLGVT